MLKQITDLAPTAAEREIAAFSKWVAADLERGAYLARGRRALDVAGKFYSPWYKLMIPVAPWPGGSLSDLQNDTGLYSWRVVLEEDVAAAVAAGEKMLAERFAVNQEGAR